MERPSWWGNLRTYENIQTIGEDWSAVLSVKAGCYGISLNSGVSGDNLGAANAKNVAFRGFALKGQVSAAGFSEHCHLLNLNGFSHLEVENLLISGFQGDGIYCGSSNDRATERHNFSFSARRVRFDGVNNNNRNALTFIDIDGVVVEDCQFLNCTRSDMPGPIDMEPNANSWATIRNVTIRQSVFKNNGGNLGEVGVMIPAAVTKMPQNLTVEYCKSDGYSGTGAMFSLCTNREPAPTQDDTNFRLSNNVAANGCMPYQILGAKRGLIKQNMFTDFSRAAILGYNEAKRGVRDIESVDNRFVRCGYARGGGISIGYASNVRSLRDKLADCGNGKPGGAMVIGLARGLSERIVLDSLEVTSPTGRTLVAVQRDARNDLDLATSKMVSPRIGLLPAQLPVK
ncbi:hypothetical protein [Cupriavidus malaysiensis]|uniref:hypothetical protein n=1 Tax=Cupriavidus malaysiensis TaxID=367825 RepID=UPI0013901345|nr:hypothetical protein [Cupriavidus malaysiensis]